MSTRIDWNRSPARGWGLWRLGSSAGGIKIADPDKRIDKSPKTKVWVEGEKEKLIKELEKGRQDANT